MADNVELSGGALEFARETEQLEQERAALRIGWSRLDFLGQLIDGCRQIAFIKKLLRTHNVSAFAGRRQAFPVTGRQHRCSNLPASHTSRREDSSEMPRP